MARIFLGLNPLGGHLWGLHEALALAGVKSDVTYFSKSPRHYPAMYEYSFKGIPKLRRHVIEAIVFIRSLLHYDLFHFSNAVSFFFNLSDLELLSAIRKPIFVSFNGSSTRPANYCLKNFKYSQFGIDGKPFDVMPRSDDVVLRRIALWEKHAESIFCLNPDLCRFVSRPIFLPYIKGKITASASRNENSTARVIRIAHAPTNRRIKGTDFFISTINKVNKPRPIFEVVLIEGMSNAEALNAIATCDVLFDQLFVGWYGGVAVEAMTMGIPAISYIRDDDLCYIPDDMRKSLPIIRTTLESLGDDLISISNSPDMLKEKGKESIEFVRQFHSPDRIAGIVLAEYRKRIKI